MLTKRGRDPVAALTTGLRGDDTGSALLVVAGATAALGALALATLSAALLAYEMAVAEHHGTLARLLAVTGLELIEAELAAGRVAVPAAGAEVVWSPPLPPPPAGAAPLPAPCGFSVRLTRVVVSPAPASFPAPAPGLPPAPPPVLVDAAAEGRCGRGFARRTARFAVAADGSVARLY